MSNCLIMITSSYPFQTQESFLESEMPYIQNGFDKIIILAIDIGRNARKMRATPENADCYIVSSQKKIVNRTKSIVSGAFNYIKGSDYSDCDRDADTLKKKLFLEYFSARGEREFKMCMKVLKKYDFSKYDSVTVYSYWFFVSALIGSKIKEKLAPECKKIKLVSRAHRYDIYDSANSLGYLPLRPFLLSRTDAVFPCSIDGENYIKNKYPVFGSKVSHSYLGTADSGLNRETDGEFNIVSCSRVTPVKRIERIVSGLELLKDAGIENIKWTHIGDGPELERVKSMADEKLGFMKVEFKGNIPNTDVINFYRKNPVDLFINVSDSEGLPVSIMEAISFGVPVIATDVGGVSEIVKNNYNGFLLDAEFTDEKLAHEVKKYALNTSEKKRKFRQNARSYWEENFDAEKNYTEFLKKIV